MKTARGQRGEGVVGCFAGLLGLVASGIAACTSDPPKPAPTVTPEQVRTHSDKAFEQLKQEERTRGTGPAGER